MCNWVWKRQLWPQYISELILWNIKMFVLCSQRQVQRHVPHCLNATQSPWEDFSSIQTSLFLKTPSFITIHSMLASGIINTRHGTRFNLCNMKFRFRLHEFAAINVLSSWKTAFISIQSTLCRAKNFLLLMLEPSSFHSPHTESIAQPFMRDKAAACCRARVLLVVPQNLTQEVDIARCQAQRLYFRELVWRQRRDDFP